MKIFFDFNNLAMRTLHLPMVEAKINPKWNFWAYLVFDQIYNFLLTAAPDDESVDVILAVDFRGKTWRKEIYEPYKADRKKDDDIDWDDVYEHMNMFIQDICDKTPIKALFIEGAEADDIIAILADRFSSEGERCIIHSGDSDYLQLLSENVSVFAPHKDEFVEFPTEIRIAGTKVKLNSVEEFLELSILTGQGGKDNVYNVKTPTDWVQTEEKKRKPGFGVKAAQKIMSDKEGVIPALEKLGETAARKAKATPEEVLEKFAYVDNYERNKKLISFQEIPRSICDLVNELYDSYNTSDPDWETLFMKYQWNSYLNNLEEVSEVLNIILGLQEPGEGTSFLEDIIEGEEEFAI